MDSQAGGLEHSVSTDECVVTTDYDWRPEYPPFATDRPSAVTPRNAPKQS